MAHLGPHSEVIRGEWGERGRKRERAHASLGSRAGYEGFEGSLLVNVNVRVGV